MRDDHCTFMQELVGYSYALTEQPPGVLPEVEDQALDVPHVLQSLSNFVLRRLLKSGNVHIANARADHKMLVHAVARNLVTNHIEIERLVVTFTQNGDLNGGALRPFEQVSHIRGAH